jgi:Predicted signal-transduction protein containing cAMP-binding and CBS domains
MNTPLSHILAQKGHAVTSVPPTASVADAVQIMNHFHIGAVVVTNPRKGLLGIFTERDVLNRIVASERDPKTTVVEAVMSTKLVTVTPATTVDEAMQIFMDNRVRHLPVIEAGVLVGLVSIGDINRHLLEEHAEEARQLRGYIQGDMTAPV